MQEKKKMGRPPKYSSEELKDKGAPKLNFRFDPLLYQHVTSRPEGPRKYLEGLVRKDLVGTTKGLDEQQ